jgi:hypothetical protein
VRRGWDTVGVRQADRYRSFITDPNPTWAPQTYGSATVKRSKGRLTCSAPVYLERVDKLGYTWFDGGRTVGSGRTLETSSRHRRATCRIEASNAGGFSTVLSARS